MELTTLVMIMKIVDMMMITTTTITIVIIHHSMLDMLGIEFHRFFMYDIFDLIT